MDTNTDLAALSDDDLDAQLAAAWDLYLAVSRGKSNRAIDNRWNTYAALRDEHARRVSARTTEAIERARFRGFRRDSDS